MEISVACPTQKYINNVFKNVESLKMYQKIPEYERIPKKN